MRKTDSSRGRVFTSTNAQDAKKFLNKKVSNDITILNKEILDDADPNEFNNLSPIERIKLLLEQSKSDNLSMFSGEFLEVFNKSKEAGKMHLTVHLLLEGISQRDSETIKESIDSLKKSLLQLVQVSILKEAWLTTDVMRLFYGCIETLKYNCFHNEINRIEVYKRGLFKFFEHFEDCIMVVGNIVNNRIIFLSDDFSITYCKTDIDKKNLERGELLIAVVDSEGLWSFDKDSAVRVKISSLRNARKSVQNWTGSKFVGEVTHEEAQRISIFLGLKPVLGTKRNLVYIGRDFQGFGIPVTAKLKSKK